MALKFVDLYKVRFGQRDSRFFKLFVTKEQAIVEMKDMQSDGEVPNVSLSVVPGMSDGTRVYTLETKIPGERYRV